MSDLRHKKLSLRGPVTLFVVILVLIMTLTYLWHFALVKDYQKLRELAAQDSAFHWTFIALGSVLFLTIIILSSMLGSRLIGHIRWSRRQSNFISSVSHELNSPLSSIKLFAQTLRKPDLATADRLDFVEKILFDVERLQRLIANILRAAEVDNRGDELQVVVQDVELHSYLHEYIADASSLYHNEGLTITLRGSQDCWVRLDRMMFRQVLDNLMDNAIRYRGDRPPAIEVNLSRDGLWSHLRFADRGIGAAQEELPNLFERFYQVEHPSPRRKRKGTGIGLYVVRSIVLAHGGKITAASDGVGQGMAVYVRLPTLRRKTAAMSANRTSPNMPALVEES